MSEPRNPSSEQNTFDEATWPRDPASGRFLCSSDRPMPAGASMRPEGVRRQWVHTNVVSDGECSEGCCDDYKCADCGHTWRVECAQ